MRYDLSLSGNERVRSAWLISVVRWTRLLPWRPCWTVSRRFWPRSFSLMIEQPPTRADKRALTQRGKIEERRQDETVTIDFPAAQERDEELPSS